MNRASLATTLLALLALSACGGGTSPNGTLDQKGGDIVADAARGVPDGLGPEETQNLELPQADVATADSESHDTLPPQDLLEPADLSQDLCLPDCTDRLCGEDGCGGLCGECDGGLLCDGGACVECLADTDCVLPAACNDGVCVGPPVCASSKDCPDDLICDKEKGYCVQCVTDDDCPENFRCVEDQTCEEILFCASDKECKEYDKVCRLEIGECVDCLADFDCANEAWCLDFVCLPDLCDQAATWPACLDGDVVSCATNGSALAVVEDCPEAHFCADATCHPWLCSPDQAGCVDSMAYLCNAEGSAYLQEVDCADQDMACSGGECKAVVCEPGQSLCLDPLTLVTCWEDGTDFETLACGEGTFCDEATVLCTPWVCTPESKGCEGETAMTCDPFGSAWGDPVACDDDGLVCSNGECIACDPACGDRECGPDACGGSCGTCGDAKTCFAGYCLAQSCPAPCNGKSNEAFLCGLDLCTPQQVSSTAISTPAGDPLDQMFNVQAKYGTDGNSLVPNHAPTLVIMATGKIANTQHNDEMPPNGCVPDPIKQGQNCDVVRSELALKAPKGATGFSVDFVFLTTEVGAQQPFDDRFYILMNAPVTTGGQTWVINAMPCIGNAQADYAWNGTNFCYIRALSGFATNPAPLNLSGTNFTGSTTWLRTRWSVAPEEAFTLTFQVADWQDSKYDSAAIIDNFQWLTGEVNPNTEPLP